MIGLVLFRVGYGYEDILMSVLTVSERIVRHRGSDWSNLCCIGQFASIMGVICGSLIM